MSSKPAQTFWKAGIILRKERGIDPIAVKNSQLAGDIQRLIKPIFSGMGNSFVGKAESRNIICRCIGDNDFLPILFPADLLIAAFRQVIGNQFRKRFCGSSFVALYMGERIVFL